jgi:hypothetical protein
MCFGSKSSSSKPAPSPQLPTFTPVRSEGTSAAERNRTGTQTGAPSMGSELGAVGTY